MQFVRPSNEIYKIIHVTVCLAFPHPSTKATLEY